MRIHRYISFLNEELSNVLERKLTIENNRVKLWHYSNVNITNGIISKNIPHGLHSTGEFRAWGRKRIFFYGDENGYNKDKIPSIDYKYICHIPIDDIYDINYNPNGYNGTYEEEYQQSSIDGFTAWTYYLGGNKKAKAPIVVSFENVEISEAYRKTEGGIYVEKDRELIDYKIGNININGENKIIMQRDGYESNLYNTYLTDETEPKTAMLSHKTTLHKYMWSDVIISTEYKSYY